MTRLKSNWEDREKKIEENKKTDQKEDNVREEIPQQRDLSDRDIYYFYGMKRKKDRQKEKDEKKKIEKLILVFFLFSTVFLTGIGVMVYGSNIYQDEIPQKNMEIFTNSFGMEFVKIPEGRFMMGSTDNENYGKSNEKPAHQVTISKPFYLGK